MAKSPKDDKLVACALVAVSEPMIGADQVVPGGLPESAYRYRTWWTVSVGNSAQSRHGWTCAGYQVSQVDLVKHLVTFAKAATAMRQVAAPQARPRSPARAGPGSLSLPVDRR